MPLPSPTARRHAPPIQHDDLRFWEGLAIAALVANSMKPVVPVREYFTGTGYLTDWLSRITAVTTVDAEDHRSPLAKTVGLTSFFRRDPLLDISKQRYERYIVAHAGLHHLSGPDTWDASDQQEAFVLACIDALSPGGTLLLVDVPKAGSQLPEVQGGNTLFPSDIMRILRTELQSELRRSLGEAEQRYQFWSLYAAHLSQSALLTDNLALPQEVLEGFVGTYRSRGHLECYRSLAEWLDWGKLRGDVAYEGGYLLTPWLFPCEASFESGICELFGLDQWTGGPGRMLSAWATHKWIRHCEASGTLLVPWCLQFALFHRASE